MHGLSWIVHLVSHNARPTSRRTGGNHATLLGLLKRAGTS
jgi:hypothetical protein